MPLMVSTKVSTVRIADNRGRFFGGAFEGRGGRHRIVSQSDREDMGGGSRPGMPGAFLSP